MSRRATRPQTRRHILLLDEDWEYLQKTFGTGSSFAASHGTTASTVVRQIVHRWVNAQRMREAAVVDAAATEQQESVA